MEWDSGMRTMMGEMVSRKEAEQRIAELEAENKHLDSMRHAEEMKYLKAQSENAKLREASQAVVEECDRQSWHGDYTEALAAAIETEGDKNES